MPRELVSADVLEGATLEGRDDEAAASGRGARACDPPRHGPRTVVLGMAFYSMRWFPPHRGQFRSGLSSRASADLSTGSCRATRGAGLSAEARLLSPDRIQLRMLANALVWLVFYGMAFPSQPATPSFQRDFMMPCVVFA